MAKRRRESDSDDAAAEKLELRSLFVDTSLDTHLAMLVSSCDTVLEFKKKLALEHKQCFPEIGEIQVHSLKVKRRSNFYHLPDNMLVCRAFQGLVKNWFVTVDASSTHRALGITNTDDACRWFSSDTNRNENLPLALKMEAAEMNYVSAMNVRPEVEKPGEIIKDYNPSIYSEEPCRGTKSRAKKKRKVSHTKDGSHNSSLKGAGANMFCSDGIDEKLHTMSDLIVKVSGTKNDLFDVKDELVFEKASPPTTSGTTSFLVDSQNLIDSNRREEDNMFKCNMDYELGQDVQANHSAGVSVMVPDSSARPPNAGDGGGDVKTASSMKKKKKHKRAAEIQDITIMEQIGKGDNKEEGKDLSLEHGHEVIMPSNRIVPDHVHPHLALKESSLLQDVERSNFSVVNSQKVFDSDVKKEDCVLESKMDNGLGQDVPTGHSGGATTSMPDHSARVMDANGGVGDVNANRKRKKKLQNISAEVQDSADVEQIGNGEMKNSGTDNEVILTSNSKGPKKSKKKEKIRKSVPDATEKAQVDDRKEADFVTNTETKQTLEYVGVGNKKMAYHADFPSAETENTNMESNQADKNTENPENKYGKTTKKRKKQKHTAAEIHENLPVKEEQQVGTEPLATTETSIGFVNSELEGRHAGSSQVLSRKSEETVGEIVVSTDDLLENSGKEIETIDFKQYFLPGEHQYKVDSCNKVRKAAKLQKSPKKVKNIDVPSVKTSNEIQNSVKSFENKKIENNKDSERTRCDTTHNSDWAEMIPSLEAPGKEVKDSGPSELRETTPLKPNDIVAAPSFQNKKNPSLKKSSSKRPGTLPNNMGNRKLLPNGTDMMLMKTQKKKSLLGLGKPVSIFQDNSGESSGDENGTIESYDRTFSPLVSSSMSEHSEELSDVSQNSTCTGSNIGKEKSTPRKSKSKIDEPISKNLTMDMILRNSALFKKAKQLASQSETQPIEFVPESQLS